MLYLLCVSCLYFKDIFLRYLIQLSYSGGAYCGWQIQPSVSTVQGVLEEALGKLLGHPVAVLGSGRTDAGVHAQRQFAHFDSVLSLSADDLTRRLNSILPKDISVATVKQVKPSFHARFSAVSRSYEYRIISYKDPFLTGLCYYYRGLLDVCAMNSVARSLLRITDFKSFSKVKTDVSSYICRVSYAKWVSVGNVLLFRISANRFLRGMVRAVAGCLLRVGQGRMSEQQFLDIVASRNRRKVPFSLPAHGLFLTDVSYDFT